ncbi:glycosyltransferase [Streptomyces sp. NPDC015220]|uniref:glycosyltransferase n=1 Tax=Streptomyces sp. NPDC015220 TaxID=3364947 RepID=UPI0036F7C0A3
MTAGSRGDVAPFTGLGHGLTRAGHAVTLVTHGCFEPLVEGSGLGFHPLPVDPRAELDSARGRGLHRSATSAGKMVRAVGLARAAVARMTDDLIAAAEKNDVLLLSGSLGPVGHAIAEALGMPSIGAHLQPLSPTREFAPPLLGGGHWGGAANRLAWHGVDLAVERVFSAAVPAVRTRLGLPAARAGMPGRVLAGRRRPVLHGFSPLVVPRPRDWRAGLEVCGYWWPHDRGERLPDELREFLDAGAAPVFVGLGSATVPDPAGLSRTIVRALRLAGLRGVVQRGWGGLEASGDGVLAIGEVPHSALFPRMAAVVHHAGAGTTAAGLRAGVPAVPLPVQFDEGFWAERLISLGVAPSAVPLRALTADALATALDRATRDPAHRSRAEALGARIRAEDGVAPVLSAVDRLAG